jgi:hypothetical protein
MEPSQTLIDLGQRRVTLVAELDAIRGELAHAIRGELDRGVPQSIVARATGYTREQIRRIARATPERAAS